MQSSSNKSPSPPPPRKLLPRKYSRRQKNVSILFRRTVKVRSVPLPFYGAFYGYRLSKNGKRTVEVR